MVRGFECFVLENTHLLARILPALGGRVWELWDRARDRQWIWHRPGFTPTPPRPNDAYEEIWAGGWEELFPNDAAGLFEGQELPDHGEWWRLPWSVEEFTLGYLRLAARTTSRRAACIKQFWLPPDSPELVIRYRITSEESSPFHFMFKQHCAVAITPACTLALPGGTVTAVDPSFGALMPGSGPFSWPLAGQVDLSRIPPASEKAREFVAVSDLAAGWCGVDDVERGATFRMHFDRSLCPFVFLFLAYGGWRDCYVAVLEPNTNRFKDLDESLRAGQAARLDPGQTFEVEFRVVLGGLG